MSAPSLVRSSYSPLWPTSWFVRARSGLDDDDEVLGDWAPTPGSGVCSPMDVPVDSLSVGSVAALAGGIIQVQNRVAGDWYNFDTFTGRSWWNGDCKENADAQRRGGSLLVDFYDFSTGRLRSLPPSLAGSWRFESYTPGKVMYFNSETGVVTECPWTLDSTPWGEGVYQSKFPAVSREEKREILEAKCKRSCAAWHGVSHECVTESLLRAFLLQARSNFERFHGTPPGSSKLGEVLDSSAGLLGWAGLGNINKRQKTS